MELHVFYHNKKSWWGEKESCGDCNTYDVVLAPIAVIVSGGVGMIYPFVFPKGLFLPSPFS